MGEALPRAEGSVEALGPEVGSPHSPRPLLRGEAAHCPVGENVRVTRPRHQLGEK